MSPNISDSHMPCDQWQNTFVMPRCGKKDVTSIPFAFHEVRRDQASEHASRKNAAPFRSSFRAGRTIYSRMPVEQITYRLMRPLIAGRTTTSIQRTRLARNYRAHPDLPEGGSDTRSLRVHKQRASRAAREQFEQAAKTVVKSIASEASRRRRRPVRPRGCAHAVLCGRDDSGQGCVDRSAEGPRTFAPAGCVGAQCSPLLDCWELSGR